MTNPSPEPLVEAVVADDAITTGPKKNKPSASNRMLQSRSMVLATLFLVTGAIGIPLLWVSQQFSTAERVFWSCVLVIYTTVLMLVAGGVIWWMYQRTIGAVYS